MKSKLIFAFAVVAAFASVLLSGCGKDSSTATCYDFSTTSDTGQHVVYAGETVLPLSKIHDSLYASVSGTTVTIHSQALDRNLIGHIDASDCNKIVMDSVIFNTGDTLRIATTLPGLGGFVKISDVHAGGEGTIDADGVITTRINVVSGHTNITSPFDLTNITPALALNLRGTFIKYP
jgi:hypothetical protein